MEPPPDDEELVQKLLGSLPLVYQEEEEAVIMSLINEEAHRSNTLSQKKEGQAVHVANSATNLFTLKATQCRKLAEENNVLQETISSLHIQHLERTKEFQAEIIKLEGTIKARDKTVAQLQESEALLTQACIVSAAEERELNARLISNGELFKNMNVRLSKSQANLEEATSLASSERDKRTKAELAAASALDAKVILSQDLATERQRAKEEAAQHMSELNAATDRLKMVEAAAKELEEQRNWLQDQIQDEKQENENLSRKFTTFQVGYKKAMRELAETSSRLARLEVELFETAGHHRHLRFQNMRAEEKLLEREEKEQRLLIEVQLLRDQIIDQAQVLITDKDSVTALMLERERTHKEQLSAAELRAHHAEAEAEKTKELCAQQVAVLDEKWKETSSADFAKISALVFSLLLHVNMYKHMRMHKQLYTHTHTHTRTHAHTHSRIHTCVWVFV